MAMADMPDELEKDPSTGLSGYTRHGERDVRTEPPSLPSRPKDGQRRREGFVVMASHLHRMAATLILIGSPSLTTACRSSSSMGTAVRQTAAFDCAAQLRYEGVSYTAYRLTKVQPSRLGDAQRVCGRSPQRIGEGPVTVWRFPGLPATQVLGTASANGRFAIYVADSVPPGERSRIVAALRSDGR